MKKAIENFKKEIYDNLPKVVYSPLNNHLKFYELVICPLGNLRIEDGKLHFSYLRIKDDVDLSYQLDIDILIDNLIWLELELKKYNLFINLDKLNEHISRTKTVQYEIDELNKKIAELQSHIRILKLLNNLGDKNERNS